MAKMENLVQSFDNNSLNSWTQQGAGTPGNQVKVQNGQVEITTTGSSGDYNYLQAPTSYDLTGSYAFVRLLSVGSQAANFDCIPLNLQLDASNNLWWDIGGNSVQPFKKVAGSQATVGSSMTYSTSTHRWLRIREAGGTVFWDYSTDGQAWINQASVSNPFSITALTPLIEAGQFGAASADTMKVDNFNFRNSGYQRIGVGDGMSRSEVAN